MNSTAPIIHVPAASLRSTASTMMRLLEQVEFPPENVVVKISPPPAPIGAQAKNSGVRLIRLHL